jgi:maltose alpha-D-glucosyltransferase/alpha-amylase
VPWAGSPPVELIGRSTFPPIGLEGYPVTLGPHGFFWLQVEGC